MNHEQAYSQLLSHQKQTVALSQAAGLIAWDQETMMPREGAEARAEQSAALAAVIHARNSDPHIGEWCDVIDPGRLDAVARANLREALRSHRRATSIPESLSEELARLTALAQGIWAKARADEDPGQFLPSLETIVGLKRQEAACLKTANGSLYDALLDDFEPGMTSGTIAGLLSNLRTGLVRLRERIGGSHRNIPALTGTFGEAEQMRLARRLAGIFNYRWEAGRLDKAVHPFSSGYRSDSRITTRVDPRRPFDCLYSTIHEVGHANYDQNRAPEMDRTPAGGYASMGIHESQSRMLENQIGRSRAFMEWLFPQMQEAFGPFGPATPDELYACVNEVKPGYIRTEADEVHYNLHILMRFDLEQALIGGDLQVSELEEAWNARFAADFGRAVDKPSNGVLQDVHWSVGLFGYFPTYSLGNIYAAELYAAMGDDIPDREQLIANGDLGALSNWLQEKIHRHGNVMTAPELMKSVCGREPDEKALLAYLEDKFSALYEV